MVKARARVKVRVRVTLKFGFWGWGWVRCVVGVPLFASSRFCCVVCPWSGAPAEEADTLQRVQRVIRCAERAQRGRREGAERTSELERPREYAAVHSTAAWSALGRGGGARARVRPAAIEDPRQDLAGLGDEAVAGRRPEQ